MTKKSEKPRAGKQTDKLAKTEREKKKPGRKPLKVPISSPKDEKPATWRSPGQTPSPQSEDALASPAKKTRGRKPAAKISVLVDPAEAGQAEPPTYFSPMPEKPQSEQNNKEPHSPPSNTKRQLAADGRDTPQPDQGRPAARAEPGGQAGDVHRQLEALTATITQLSAVTLGKIDELRAHVDGSRRAPAPVVLDSSLAELLRRMISEQIAKEFETQFELLKDSFSDSKMKKIAKLSKRGRPSKLLEPGSPKSSVEEENESPTHKKRGRKKKTLGELSPDKQPSLAKNVSSVAELIDDPRKDFRINNIITFSNLTEQPEARKEPLRPIKLPEPDSEPEKMPEPEPERKSVSVSDAEHESHVAEPVTPKLEPEPEPQSREQNSSALLPSVPLKSIQILIEDHKSEGAEAKKPAQTSPPASRPHKHAALEQKDDVRSVRTEVDAGKNVESEHDMELEFDFNAFSLNS